MVDVTELREVFPYGKLEIEVVEGGMLCSSHNIVPELGELAACCRRRCQWCCWCGGYGQKG